MGKQRRQHSEQFKFKVVLEAAKGLRTVNEIASEYSLHPNQAEQLEKATAGRRARGVQPQSRAWADRARRAGSGIVRANRATYDGVGVAEKSEPCRGRHSRMVRKLIHAEIDRPKPEAEFLEKPHKCAKLAGFLFGRER